VHQSSASSGRRLRAGGSRTASRPKTGPSPVDRARAGSKHHLITEAHGIPLAVSLTDGNRNDVTQLMPLIQAVPAVRAVAAVRVDGLRRSTPTAATTTTSTANRYERSGSRR
jgi:IS5 family transposase